MQLYYSNETKMYPAIVRLMNFKTLVNDLIRSEILNMDVPLIIPQDFQELSPENGTTSRAVP